MLADPEESFPVDDWYHFNENHAAITLIRLVFLFRVLEESASLVLKVRRSGSARSDRLRGSRLRAGRERRTRMKPTDPEELAHRCLPSFLRESLRDHVKMRCFALSGFRIESDSLGKARSGSVPVQGCESR